MPTPDRPVLAGSCKLIGSISALSHHLFGNEEHCIDFENWREKKHNVAVDYHTVRDEADTFTCGDASARRKRDVNLFYSEDLRYDRIYKDICIRNPFLE
jgi:hypothetical protein